MASYQPDLLAVEKASEKVGSLGFDTKPEQISESIYKWQGDDSLEQTLILNVTYPEFSLTSNFATNPAVLSGQNLPTEIEAEQIAKNFAKSLSYLPDDVDDKKTLAILYSISQGVINQATSIAGTNMIGIYFFQKNKDNLPIVYPDGKSTMNITVSGGENNPRIIDARFTYQKIDNKNSTYPIKTSEEAFEELKKGKGYIASLNPSVSDISIKKVYLGYFIGKQKQDFLLPVIVFEGTGDFIAYISAIEADWIQN